VPHSRPRLLLVALAIRANRRAEIPLKHALLQVDRAPPATTHLRIIPSEEDALAKLPALNAEEEQECSDKDNTPLPADALVSEHGIVDDRDIQDGEDGNEPEYNREEQELVPPDVAGPLGEVLCGSGLHHEERAAHVQHLPRKEQREPSEASKGSCASADHSVAGRVVGLVAVVAEVAVTEAEHHDREGCEAEGGYPEAVDEHVDHDFDGEDTALEL
jgi:hypothetical protein